MRLVSILMLFLLTGCSGTPDGLTPVSGFDDQRYLGTWYEIARLDHSFERGLERVTAHYSRNPDGSIRVINRGYDPALQQWRQAEGLAKFVSSPDVGHLKVSFFGPFYGGYNVLLLDADYQYALVSGPNRDYLWLLARTPTLAPTTYDQVLEQARQMGFDTQQLIRVKQ
ncbi:lipocalin family protein [Pseudaeromonas pectinilytica]